MKRVCIVSLLLVSVVLSAPASAELKGIGLGVGAMEGDFFFQVRKDFWLGGEVSQIVGQAGVYFHGKTTFRIDADYHFVIESGKGRFYPLVGLQLAFNSDDVKFGVNGGGGLNFMLTESLAAFGELKYTFFGWDGWQIMGGVYF